MKNLILTLIITLPLTLWGQGWEKTFGGEENDTGNSVQQTSDGGYIITGSWSRDFFDIDVYLIKTDSQGDTLWTKTFGGDGNEYGNSVQQTTDGGYIITGMTKSFGNGGNDVYLIKTDENGNEQWFQTFGGEDGDGGNSIQQTTDGGYIITGETYSFGNSESDVYLIKTDSQGDSIWTKTFGGEDNDRGNSIQQTTDGGFIITGVSNETYTVNGSISSDLWLLKTDENGNEQWNQNFESICEGFTGNSVEQTTDGGYIISGTDFLYTNFGPPLCEGNILIKTDGSGNEQWSQYISSNIMGTFSGTGNSVKQTTDGGYIIIGTKDSDPDYTPKDVYLIKTDSQGDSIWTKTFGGEGDEYGYSVQQTSDGGYILTGSTESFGNGERDVYLIKTNQFGNITSTFEISLPNPERKLEKTVNLKGQEIKPQINQPIIEIYDDGTRKRKIIIE